MFPVHAPGRSHAVYPLTADALVRVIALMARAEERFHTGRDGAEPEVVAGMSLVREALNVLENYRGFEEWVPRNIFLAQAEARRSLERLSGDGS